ncbi:hypothetical protein AB1Z82_001489 [Bacillus cereus]
MSYLKQSEYRSAAFFKTPSHLPTNNIYGVTFKEMIVPKGTATRAEAAAFLNRMLKVIEA